MPLTPGQLVLDRYLVEGLIGQGGMGAVYRARHHKLGMPVAVKTITGDASPELVARFGREAQLLARVRHQNVVSILDVGDAPDGSPCMVMEFLEGEALDARLERRRALPWNEVRAIGLYILQGLDAIHSAGIIHRDLKPANVLAVRGTPEVIKLVDFGIAHSTGADAVKYTQAGAVIGTPAYMSPEQLVGAAVDARSDLYALGLLLYELAVGRLPFGGDPNGALRRLREPVPPMAAPAPLPAIPDAANALLQSVLAIETSHRPGSAKAFYQLLHAARGANGASSQAVPAQAAPGAAPRPAAPPPRTVVARGAPPPPQPPPTQAQVGVDLAMQPQAVPVPVPIVPTATQLQSGSRALVAARLPVSRMSREEQRTLAQLAAPGRAYHLGGGVWFAVVPGAHDEDTRNVARALGARLQERFGDTCKVVFTLASPSFALTPASLSGAAPLPEELNELLGHLL
jgi:Protein kinase domain